MGASQVAKIPHANAGDARDVVRSLGQEDPLEEEMAIHLQYPCLGNPMDRAAWWAAVHGVTKNRTRLSNVAHCAQDQPPVTPSLALAVRTPGQSGCLLSLEFKPR